MLTSSFAMSCEVSFRLDQDAPQIFFDAWLTVVEALTQSDETDKVRVELHAAISQKVQATTTLHENDSKILKRSEGGFGGDNNKYDRQIRFVSREHYAVYNYDPLEIRMCPSNGNVKPLVGYPYDKDPDRHKMEWTMPDLIDFKHAAMMALNEYLYKRCGLPIRALCLKANIVFCGFDEENAGTAAEKKAFEFFVNNYPNSATKP